MVLNQPFGVIGKLAGLEKKKKKSVENVVIPPVQDVVQPTPEVPKTSEERKEEANLFIRAREKALSRGATKDEANTIAIEQTQGVSTRQVTQLEAQQAAQQREEMAGNVGQTQPLIPQNQPVDFKSALAAGVGRGAIAGTAGAATGATAGLLGGPAAPISVPVAAAGVGATAFVGGFISGFTSKLKQDTSENLQADFTTLTDNKRNMRNLIIDAKTDPIGASDAFNNQLTAIDQSYADLFAASKKDVAKFNSVDAQVQLQKFENFYAPGGMRDIYVGRMRAVLINPATDVGDLIAQAQADNLEQPTD